MASRGEEHSDANRRKAEKQQRIDEEKEARREEWSKAHAATKGILTTTDKAAVHPSTGDIGGVTAGKIRKYDKDVRGAWEKKEGKGKRRQHSHSAVDRPRNSSGGGGGSSRADDDDNRGRSSHAAPAGPPNYYPLPPNMQDFLVEDPQQGSRAPSQAPSVYSEASSNTSGFRASLPYRPGHPRSSWDSRSGASVADTNISSSRGNTEQRRADSPASTVHGRGRRYASSTLGTDDVSYGVPLSHGGASIYYTASTTSTETGSVAGGVHSGGSGVPDSLRNYYRGRSPPSPMQDHPTGPPQHTTGPPSQALSAGTESPSSTHTQTPTPTQTQGWKRKKKKKH